MGDRQSELSSARAAPGQFPPTHWTVVVNAGKDCSPDAREAVGRLYSAYLRPLIAFLRRCGKNEEEARDLVQGFFESLLQRQGLAKVSREGRFRCWLLASLKNFVSDEWDKARARKRGGGATHVELATQSDEPGVVVANDGRTPDQEYDRQFALRFLELVMARLEQEYQQRGKSRIFTCMQPFLLEKRAELSHADLGQQLGMQEGTVSQEISRLRKRYREIFDEELEKLVGGGEELDSEKQFLFAALRY